ncbi:LOW QUALITY PROTEIN: FAD dependent oxidoreductase [Trema orientale]|uniref:FAD dependent oxidoreductase n=1 Tax=Trema orientale TaxID=63057 RepID=A0A2P5EDD0_TREOI|nr:LOW QUALITY PROTEIN: FAD dependent oxidoreductase [Trema orientale]
MRKLKTSQTGNLHMELAFIYIHTQLIKQPPCVCKKGQKRKEEMEMEEDIVIVGAGIAGLATALALKRVGVKALVLERSDGLRATGAALGLFPNAWLALDALGVSQKLTSVYAPCKK